MKLEHEFTVPVPPGQAWAVLLDVERIAPCMPGATLERIDGDDFGGRVKVKVGPIQVTYAGTARIVERDEDTRRAVIEATGKEARGPGTAAMTVTAQLHESGEGTRVTAVSDLSVTGRPAQFGRGVMADVGAKIIGQFAECLAAELAASPAPDEAIITDVAPATVTSQDPREGQPPTRYPPEAIDLLDVATGPVVKRLAPVMAAVVVLLIAIAVAIKLRRRPG
jgi:uncharacterized protein